MVAVGIGVLVLVSMYLAFAYMCANAPEGYEDEDGFHYGPKP